MQEVYGQCQKQVTLVFSGRARSASIQSVPHIVSQVLLWPHELTKIPVETEIRRFTSFSTIY